LIFIANIYNFDVEGLLVFIFVQKALDVVQNARGHMWTHQKVYIFLVFLTQNSGSVEKALDVQQNARGHM